VRFTEPAGLGTASTVDLSAGGCSVIVPLRIEPGEDVSLELELPRGSGKLLLSGWVTWGAPAKNGAWRIGIAFAGVTQRERDLLAAVVLEAAVPATFRKGPWDDRQPDTTSTD